jgi:regulator of nucleoside diphosphate kinase
MIALHSGERTLTELDFVRLQRLSRAAASPRLARILGEAEVVPSDQVPPDVVTMYAKAIVRDLALRRRRILCVCYPQDADAASGRVSVHSPAGMALLGLPVGAVARWAGPGGEPTVVRIEGILFQPEAAGDYLT